MGKALTADPEDQTGMPLVLLVLFLAFLGFIATIIFLPLVLLVGYPVLLIIAVFFLPRWFLLEGRGLFSRRLAQLVCYWTICFGLVVMTQGILIAMDSALKGPPPTPEEKRQGRTIAYSGAGISALAAVGAYVFQPWNRRGRKVVIPDLDELPAGPGG
jgi:hypothetical protein